MPVMTGLRLTDDDPGGLPKHEQLRAHLAEQVARGRLKPGDLLPPELELAESLGVARSTVRQAMAGLERDGLIRRVQGKGTFVEARPDAGRAGGSEVFALVLPETQTGFYPALQRSFEAEAARTHHQMLVCCSDNDVDRQAGILLQLLDRGVAGVALVPPTSRPTPAYHARALRKAGVPLVYCHRPVEGVPAPLLALPFGEVGRTAGAALAAAGHRRVAVFAVRPSPATDAYKAGLADALAAAGGRLIDPGTPPADGPRADVAAAEPWVRRELERLLAGPDRPTALFATFDSMAELLFLLLGQMGVRVPDDVSLVGVGGSQRLTPFARQLTSVTVDEVLVGRTAAGLLDRMARGALAADASDTHPVPVALSAGRTLAPAR